MEEEAIKHPCQFIPSGFKCIENINEEGFDATIPGEQLFILQLPLGQIVNKQDSIEEGIQTSCSQHINSGSGIFANWRRVCCCNMLHGDKS